MLIKLKTFKFAKFNGVSQHKTFTFQTPVLNTAINSRSDLNYSHALFNKTFFGSLAGRAARRGSLWLLVSIQQHTLSASQSSSPGPPSQNHWQEQNAPFNLALTHSCTVSFQRVWYCLMSKRVHCRRGCDSEIDIRSVPHNLSPEIVWNRSDVYLRITVLYNIHLQFGSITWTNKGRNCPTLLASSRDINILLPVQDHSHMQGSF